MVGIDFHFKVLDFESGREISTDKIVKIAKEYGLMECDIDDFAISSEGQLLLIDDCGKCAYVDTKKYKVGPFIEQYYPNLEFLENVFVASVKNKFGTDIDIAGVELVAMFPQTWPNTAGGFSEPGMAAGDAMTTEYTTVMNARIYQKERKGKDPYEEVFVVFFGDRPAYLVENANSIFYNDLNARRMKSLYEAMKVY